MRRLLVAATLGIVAACGTVLDIEDHGEDGPGGGPVPVTEDGGTAGDDAAIDVVGPLVDDGSEEREAGDGGGRGRKGKWACGPPRVPGTFAERPACENHRKDAGCRDGLPPSGETCEVSEPQRVYCSTCTSTFDELSYAATTCTCRSSDDDDDDDD